jgi:hypothetical protein
MRLLSLTVLLAACLGATIGTITFLPDRAYAAKEQARYWTELLKHWNDPSDVPRPADLRLVPLPSFYRAPAVPYLDQGAYDVMNTWLKSRRGLVAEKLHIGMRGDCWRARSKYRKAWSDFDSKSANMLRLLPWLVSEPVTPRSRPLPDTQSLFRFSPIGFTRDYKHAVFSVQERNAGRSELKFFMADRVHEQWSIHEAACSELWDIIETVDWD